MGSKNWKLTGRGGYEIGFARGETRAAALDWFMGGRSTEGIDAVETQLTGVMSDCRSGRDLARLATNAEAGAALHPYGVSLPHNVYADVTHSDLVGCGLWLSPGRVYVNVQVREVRATDWRAVGDELHAERTLNGAPVLCIIRPSSPAVCAEAAPFAVISHLSCPRYGAHMHWEIRAAEVLARSDYRAVSPDRRVYAGTVAEAQAEIQDWLATAAAEIAA